jgi:hypothetical protein
MWKVFSDVCAGSMQPVCPYVRRYLCTLYLMVCTYETYVVCSDVDIKLMIRMSVSSVCTYVLIYACRYMRGRVCKVCPLECKFLYDCTYLRMHICE